MIWSRPNTPSPKRAAHRPTPGGAFTVLALRAVTLILNPPPQGVRACDRCGWFFVDSSRGRQAPLVQHENLRQSNQSRPLPLHPSLMSTPGTAMPVRNTVGTKARGCPRLLVGH